MPLYLSVFPVLLRWFAFQAMSAVEVLNPRPLIPCKKNSVQKQIGNRTQRIRRFNGKLEYAQYTGETKRENNKTLFKK